MPTTVDLAAMMPRIQALRRHLGEGEGVSIDLELWHRQRWDGQEVTTLEWRVWLTKGSRRFVAATLTDALALAEQAEAMSSVILPELVLPDTEETGRTTDE